MVPVRTLRFAKHGNHLILRYNPGGDEMIDYIMALAEDKDCPLDWLDAATLSFQVAQNTASSPCTIPKEESHEYQRNYRRKTIKYE